METKKISELESANSITSSDVLPIVQSGETKKVTTNVLLGGVLDTMYPIGSIYISILDTNPSTYFGGVWQAFGQGRTLVGLNASDEDFDTLLKAGGDKTHTLTIDEIPSHEHEGVYWQGSSSRPLSLNSASTYPNGYGLSWTPGAGDKGNMHTDYTGGGQPHNILQPYIVVSMWLRVG